jgi:hypothetical protein
MPPHPVLCDLASLQWLKLCITLNKKAKKMKRIVALRQELEYVLSETGLEEKDQGQPLAYRMLSSISVGMGGVLTFASRIFCCSDRGGQVADDEYDLSAEADSYPHQGVLRRFQHLVDHSVAYHKQSITSYSGQRMLTTYALLKLGWDIYSKSMLDLAISSGLFAAPMIVENLAKNSSCYPVVAGVMGAAKCCADPAGTVLGELLLQAFCRIFPSSTEYSVYGLGPINFGAAGYISGLSVSGLIRNVDLSVLQSNNLRQGLVDKGDPSLCHTFDPNYCVSGTGQDSFVVTDAAGFLTRFLPLLVPNSTVSACHKDITTCFNVSTDKDWVYARYVHQGGLPLMDELCATDHRHTDGYCVDQNSRPRDVVYFFYDSLRSIDALRGTVMDSLLLGEESQYLRESDSFGGFQFRLFRPLRLLMANKPSGSHDGIKVAGSERADIVMPMGGLFPRIIPNRPRAIVGTLEMGGKGDLTAGGRIFGEITQQQGGYGQSVLALFTSYEPSVCQRHIGSFMPTMGGLVFEDKLWHITAYQFARDQLLFTLPKNDGTAYLQFKMLAAGNQTSVVFGPTDICEMKPEVCMYSLLEPGSPESAPAVFVFGECGQPVHRVETKRLAICGDTDCVKPTEAMLEAVNDIEYMAVGVDQGDIGIFISPPSDDFCAEPLSRSIKSQPWLASQLTLMTNKTVLGTGYSHGLGVSKFILTLADIARRKGSDDVICIQNVEPDIDAHLDMKKMAGLLGRLGFSQFSVIRGGVDTQSFSLSEVKGPALRLLLLEESVPAHEFQCLLDRSTVILATGEQSMGQAIGVDDALMVHDGVFADECAGSISSLANQLGLTALAEHFMPDGVKIPSFVATDEAGNPLWKQLENYDLVVGDDWQGSPQLEKVFCRGDEKYRVPVAKCSNGTDHMIVDSSLLQHEMGVFRQYIHNNGLDHAAETIAAKVVLK